MLWRLFFLYSGIQNECEGLTPHIILRNVVATEPRTFLWKIIKKKSLQSNYDSIWFQMASMAAILCPYIDYYAHTLSLCLYNVHVRFINENVLHILYVLQVYNVRVSLLACAWKPEINRLRIGRLIISMHVWKKYARGKELFLIFRRFALLFRYSFFRQYVKYVPVNFLWAPSTWSCAVPQHWCARRRTDEWTDISSYENQWHWNVNGRWRSWKVLW